MSLQEICASVTRILRYPGLEIQEYATHASGVHTNSFRATHAAGMMAGTWLFEVNLETRHDGRALCQIVEHSEDHQESGESNFYVDPKDGNSAALAEFLRRLGDVAAAHGPVKGLRP